MLAARVSNEEERLIRKYAEVNNLSVSELIRTAVIEKIEDDIDLQLCKEAIKEFEKDPTTYTLDEIEKELGLK